MPENPGLRPTPLLTDEELAEIAQRVDPEWFGWGPSRTVVARLLSEVRWLRARVKELEEV